MATAEDVLDANADERSRFQVRNASLIERARAAESEHDQQREAMNELDDANASLREDAQRRGRAAALAWEQSENELALMRVEAKEADDKNVVLSGENERLRKVTKQQQITMDQLRGDLAEARRGRTVVAEPDYVSQARTMGRADYMRRALQGAVAARGPLDAYGYLSQIVTWLEAGGGKCTQTRGEEVLRSKLAHMEQAVKERNKSLDTVIDERDEAERCAKELLKLADAVGKMPLMGPASKKLLNEVVDCYFDTHAARHLVQKMGP